MAELIETIGIDRLIFGSDWPHGEGRPAPIDYLEDLAGIGSEDVERFMRTTGRALLGLA